MKPTYAQRNTLLLRMGFTSYDNYLAGVLWAEIRDAVVNRDSHTCKLCDNKSEVVHHIDYEEATMRGESLDGLVSVCCRCHKNIEFSKKGEKRSLLSAQYAYRNLMGCKLGLKKKSKQVMCCKLLRKQIRGLIVAERGSFTHSNEAEKRKCWIL